MRTQLSVFIRVDVGYSSDKNSDREALVGLGFGIAEIWQRHVCRSIIDDGIRGVP